MASQGVSTNSRLAQMQLRFQQRQLQEREQRRVELLGSTVSDTTVRSVPSSNKSIGNGKVRQMFDQRRRGAGIDRSKPLNPISSSKMSSNSTTALNATTTTTTTYRRPTQNAGAAAGAVTNKRYHPQAITVNGYQQRNSNMTRSETFESPLYRHTNGGIKRNVPIDDLDSYNKNFLPKDLSSLSLGSGGANSVPGDRNHNHNYNHNYNHNNNNNNNQNFVTRVNSSNGIKLNPVITKKSPQLVNKNHTNTTTTTTAAMYHQQQAQQQHLNATAAARLKTPINSAHSSSRMSTTSASSSGFSSTGSKSMPINNEKNSTAKTYKPPMAASGSQALPPVGLGVCRHCGRHFIEDRLAKHEAVCQKAANAKQRKVFDAGKQRVTGTESESFNKKPQGKQKANYNANSNNMGLTANAGGGGKKNNWRKKHEEFIAAIRAAKQVQTHLARGGKLSDLPPPPPSENADYIQCPHCLRRFNEAAAARHIPKCATMLHNKPKPGVATAKKR